MKTTVLLSRSTAALLAVALTASYGWSQGTTIVDSGGFEAPAYTTTFFGTGQLEGQPPSAPWLRTVGGTSTAIVQNTVVGTGTQAVQVDRHPNSDARWAVPLFGWPSQPIVVVDFDMRVTQTPDIGGFGPFFGSEAYDTDGIGSGVGLFGSLGVDATTGDVLYQAEDTGFLTETGSTVNFDEWNHYRMILDFTFDRYSVHLNNVQLGTTTGFVDRANGLEQLTDSDISTFAAAGDAVSQALNGQAFFDNFLVRQFPNLAAVPPALLIPEPTAGLLACLGGALLLKFRQRKPR